MEPTLMSKDIIVSEHLSTKLFRFSYGDIVISKSPSDPKEYICKRITALPGDRIEYKQTKVVSEIFCPYLPYTHVQYLMLLLSI